MNFSDEERLFAQNLRRFAKERLLPEYARWDRGEPYPRERLLELARLGITGMRVPEAYGGTGASFVMAGIAAEELARGDYNTTLVLQIAAISADIIAAHATDSIKEQWLPKLASGEQVVAFGLTEPGAGSDAAALTTTAIRDGDEYVVRGEKASITFAGLADACIVFARTGGEGARGIGALLVPLDSPGVSRTKYQSVGERLTQRGSLHFDDVRVPAGNILGDPAGGFYQAMGAFDYNRAIIALACVGAAQQSLDESVEYAKQRETSASQSPCTRPSRSRSPSTSRSSGRRGCSRMTAFPAVTVGSCTRCRLLWRSGSGRKRPSMRSTPASSCTAGWATARSCLLNSAFAM